MNELKTVFETHVDNKGHLKEGKERFECECGGESYIKGSVVLPNGFQHFEFKCTDCQKEWTESY